MTTNALANLLIDKTYMFCVDFIDPKYNSGAMLAYIKDSRMISSWSAPMAGVYLLKSPLAAFPLSESLRAIAGDARCLLIEVNPQNSGGWLPPAAWDWLRPTTPPVSTSTSLLEGLRRFEKKA